MCSSNMWLILFLHICRGLISEAGCHWWRNLFVGYTGHSRSRRIQVSTLDWFDYIFSNLVWVAWKSIIHHYLQGTSVDPFWLRRNLPAIFWGIPHVCDRLVCILKFSELFCLVPVIANVHATCSYVRGFFRPSQ